MTKVIAAFAVLAALYALWIVGRADLLRLVQGVRYVTATVVRHDASSDGFVPIYEFTRAGIRQEVPGFTAHASPKPAVGTRLVLGHPARRPDLARPQQRFARTLMYAGFAAWIGLFADIWLGWIRWF